MTTSSDRSSSADHTFRSSPAIPAHRSAPPRNPAGQARREPRLTRRRDPRLKRRRRALPLLPALLVAGAAPALNLERLATTGITSIELLDVEYRDGVLAIPGGLGGTTLVDVHDPAAPTELSNYHDTACDYGRLYNTAVGETLIVGAGRNCSLALLQPDADYQLQVVGRYQNSDFSYEDAAISGALVYAAAHSDGLEIINVSDPAHPFAMTTVATENAWAVRLNGNYAYVADGDAGIAMIDISNPESPFLAAQYNTSGNASHLGVSDSLVAVADWDDVEILRYTPAGTLELAGLKKSGGRVMGIEIAADIVYVAEWRVLQTYRYGAIAGPDIDLNQTELHFPTLEIGARMDTTLILRNSGHSPLSITSLKLSHADFSLDPAPPFDIPAGAEEPLTITRHASAEEVALQDLTIISNDSDDPVLHVVLEGNGPDLGVGDPAPDFTLPVLDGPSFTLSEHRGSVVVLTFFASW